MHNRPNTLVHASCAKVEFSMSRKKIGRRWLDGTRHGVRVIGTTPRFPDGSTPNLRRCFTFRDAATKANDISRPSFSLFPALSVRPGYEDTGKRPSTRRYASFTGRVRRVMPLKRFLFRSPLSADIYAPTSFTLLLLLLLIRLLPFLSSFSSISLACLSFDDVQRREKKSRYWSYLSQNRFAIY